LKVHNQLKKTVVEENNQRKELAQRHSELITALENSKKPFVKKLLKKFKGTQGILLL